jgi:predicted metal-dependent phosphoesterase TrpH
MVDPQLHVDYHCHTRVSDGALAPEALVDLALAQGVESLAITDHDTMEGFRQVREACPLELVPGVEWSTGWDDREVHVVGLGLDAEAACLRGAEIRQQSVRLERAFEMARQLEKAGFDGAMAHVETLAQEKGLQIGRPHLAAWLVAQGHVLDVKAAFRRWLGICKPAYVRSGWMRLDEAIALNRSAGGLSVLAHPHRYGLSRSKTARLIADFVAAGGEALEVAVPTLIGHERDWISRQCIESGLYASTGSDFHRPGQPWAMLGRVPPLPTGCKPVRTLLFPGDVSS